MIGACAVLALAAASCGKCGDNSCDAAAATDSLSLSYGQYVGTMLQGEFTQYNNGADKAQKQEFLRGMQIVFGADNSRNTRMGMQVALQMMNEIDQLESQGVEFNKAATMNAFKQAFLADSVDYFQGRSLESNFRIQLDRARKAAQEAKEAEKAKAPAAVDNVKAGEEYVAKLKAENSAVQTTASGLTYIIEVPGEDPKPTENATVVVNYTGKHLNGEVFDSTDGRGPATFNLQGVVPGFSEGLQLIGKGGKATLYIPGNLGYGANGQPAANIGPNEMLVFDVELLEINE